MPSSRRRGCRRNSSVTGIAEISRSSETTWKAGVSITLSRIQAPMASSTMLSRKQARQPHARKASSGNWLAIAKAPLAGTARPARRCGRSCRRSRGTSPARLVGEEHGAAVLTADADALQDPQHHQQQRRPEADLVVGRQQADRRHADAHDHQGPDQHGLAADAVAEVAEDQPADRAGHKPDGEGAEAGELRRRAGQAVEEELVEDQPGSHAVEEEVVPLDGGADGAGDSDLACLGGIGRGGGAAGRPVVAGVMDDSFAAWAAKRSGWGLYVVNHYR